MAEQGESEDKPYEPSQKKIMDARRKGNIARSTDLNTTAAYGGLALSLLIWGEDMIRSFGGLLTGFFSDRLWRAAMQPGHGNGALLLGPAIDIAVSILPIFLMPALGVLLSLGVQRAFIFYGGNLEMKLSRLSPISNFKKKFGRRGLFEFFKSFVKLMLYTCALIWFLINRQDEILISQMLEARQVAVLMMDVALLFLLVSLGISAMVGVVDYLFQNAEHQRNLRMSHRELMDEMKESEGDPAMKQKRRQRAMDIARTQMLHDMKEADVVIVNPEHFAVALKWSRTKRSAPVCVAKGVDEMAAVIRRLAADYSVPVYSEPPTARALYAAVEIGEEIGSEHYKAVAAAIRFADELRRKKRHSPFGSY
ncbi:EscU/YscU/HrcU family type III secretion system export apparatus switch protein [Mangrovicoccus ximenensis]|uniref:EscU/YscU/HrcU family type III secretion system export apparatus switch protein n=1 Tax=Mangrovicoccus ximenensis TaxID=1911570 RepID=UPI000D39F6A4|nr:flagellar type III secretion system protein FlhB [Mangrovicoccus ximenensis]